MDGWGGWMDGWMDGRTIEEGMDERMGGLMNGCVKKQEQLQQHLTATEPHSSTARSQVLMKRW